MSKLLAMPDKVLEVVLFRSKKSSFLLLIQQEAPVSMQIGLPPGEKFKDEVTVFGEESARHLGTTVCLSWSLKA
jgi:hypothetical protein